MELTEKQKLEEQNKIFNNQDEFTRIPHTLCKDEDSYHPIIIQKK